MSTDWSKFVNVTIEISEPVRAEELYFCTPGFEHLCASPEEIWIAHASVCAWLCGAELTVTRHDPEPPPSDFDLEELGSEWAAAVEGWSVGL